MRALVASGTGRYADPWHPFSRTSPLIAAILEDAGFVVRIDHDVDHAMARLAGVDLLVVNAGDPWRESEDHAAGASSDAPSAFAEALGTGIGVLAMHSAVSSLRDYPDWFPAVGGMWVPGASWHPPASITHVSGGRLPDGNAVADFDVFDERYSRIQQLGARTVVAHHPGEHGPEPTAWVREVGMSRIAVDLLGHDEKSYDSPGHRELLVQLACWASGAG